MSDKKLKGKQAWCLNTVAILKPYIERKEHITRSTAGKLVKPVTNWQRRELDNLRKQANQIIRGENVSPLTYTVFGMTLEHPEMQPVKEAFDATIKAQREPFMLPSDLKIMGLVASEEDVFSHADGRAYCASKNDTWLIRRDSTGVMDMLIIEDDKTYVLIYSPHTYPTSGRGRRCIYPECVKVADIEIISAEVCKPPLPPVSELITYPMHYALEKEKVRGDAYYDEQDHLHIWTGEEWFDVGLIEDGPPKPITLNWIKNIEGVDQLPTGNNNVGDMYGIMNGNKGEPDRYLTWGCAGVWFEIMRNEQTDAELLYARNQGFLKQFGLKIEEGMICRITDPDVNAVATVEETIPLEQVRSLKEPENKPNGFWSRLGRVLGFK